MLPTPSIFCCIGDSITRNAPTRAERPWTAALDLLLYPDRGTANRAKDSTTAADFLVRWTNTIRGAGFTGIVLGPGAINSILTGVSAAATYASLHQIVTEALLDGLYVVWCTGLPFKTASGWDVGKQAQSDSLNAMILATPSQSRLALLNLYPSFENPAQTLDVQYQGPDVDGLHIGQAGGNHYASLVFAAVESLFP